MHVRVEGKFNESKMDVLLTLRYFCEERGLGGLTVDELREKSGRGFNYLYQRLPVICGKSGDWEHLLVSRRAVEANGYPVFAYSISPEGLRWLQKVDPEKIKEAEKRLRPRWTPVFRFLKASQKNALRKGMKMEVCNA